MRRRCMLASLVVLILAPAASARQPGDEPRDPYTLAVDAYRRGDFAAAASIAEWPDAQLKRGTASLIVRSEWRRMEAAAMLHTDLVIRQRVTETKAILVHMELAENLVRRLPAIAIAGAENAPQFRARWFELAVSLYMAMTEPYLAGDLVNHARRAVKPNAPLRTLSGAVEEMRAHIADGNLHDPQVIAAMTMSPARRGLVLAEREYRAALALDPDYGLARVRLGRVLALRRQLKEAREELDRVANRESDDSLRYLAQLFLGALAESEHDYETARRAYTAAAETIPGAQSAIIALSFAESMLGREVQARTLLAGTLAEAAAAVDDPWSAYQNGFVSLIALRWLRQEIVR
jgi:tetratricopeptide (TPR) repeat protein